MENIQDISVKYALTLTEAAIYFNIGQSKIRELTNAANCKYVLRIGNRRMIKRKLFEQYLDEQETI